MLSSRLPSFLLLVLASVGVAACGSGGGAAEAAPAIDQSTSVPADTPTPTSTTLTTPTTETTETSDMELPDPTTDPAAAGPDDAPACRRLTDFGSEEERARWLVVNDDVMGGRSLGGRSFDGDVLVFEGDINTNGGGFASLRLPLEPGILVGHDRIELRARPDARTYVVTFDDDLASRDRRVSHRAPIEFGPPGEWQTVSVAFEDLFPAIFGRPIDDLPFREDLANRLGLMISDGADGPFRLEVDWIDLCGSADTP